jgi:hypothetical protein
VPAHDLLVVPADLHARVRGGVHLRLTVADGGVERVGLPSVQHLRKAVVVYFGFDDRLIERALVGCTARRIRDWPAVVHRKQHRAKDAPRHAGRQRRDARRITLDDIGVRGPRGAEAGPAVARIGRREEPAAGLRQRGRRRGGNDEGVAQPERVGEQPVPQRVRNDLTPAWVRPAGVDRRDFAAAYRAAERVRGRNVRRKRVTWRQQRCVRGRQRFSNRCCARRRRRGRLIDRFECRREMREELDGRGRRGQRQRGSGNGRKIRQRIQAADRKRV